MNITRGAMEPRSANVHPQVSGDSVIWTTTFKTNRSPRPTWVLQEVADPTKGIEDLVKEPLDLDASYRVSDGGGAKQVPEQQRLVTTAEYYSNQVAKAQATAGTNVVVLPVPPKAGQGRSPSGNNEICLWKKEGGIQRITNDTRDDLAPAFDGDLFAWQKAKGWPFGWEIMALNGTNRYQLTTNFYYDMAPKVHKSKVTWYGWDGNDFEIYLHDAEKGGTLQITSNQFDDVSPVIWDGTVAWEAYPAVEAEIYAWSQASGLRKLSDNEEDDFNPRIADGHVVWQGFDGDDFEIYVYNGTNTIKLTSNIHDDVDPEIRDGLVCWVGYHDNWDPEIFVWKFGSEDIIQLTTNEVEDRDPQTAGGRVIWSGQDPEDDSKSGIYLAEPK